MGKKNKCLHFIQKEMTKLKNSSFNFYIAATFSADIYKKTDLKKNKSINR